MDRRPFGHTGMDVPVIGQGTWQLRDPARAEEALRLGLDLGLTHVDTAELYQNTRSEEVVGRAIAGRREEVFLVSKVLPSNASYEGTREACERSLARLGTDRLDAYLLHWWSDRHPIEDTMRAMDELASEGKTRFVGVSNLDVEELQQAERALGSRPIVCDQVLYHLGDRSIEHRLLPYCERRGIAIVAYSPFGSGDFPPPRSRGRRVLDDVARRHGKTAHQVALNFLTRHPSVFAIPKAETPEHVHENAESVGWELAPRDINEIEAAFPLPRPGAIGMI